MVDPSAPTALERRKRVLVPLAGKSQLDANRRLAVNLARRFFHLPYEHARMSAAVERDGLIDYRSHRRGTPAATAYPRNNFQKPCRVIPVPRAVRNRVGSSGFLRKWPRPRSR